MNLKIVLIVGAVLAAGSGPLYAANTDARRMFSRDVPAAGLTKVDLTVGVGEVHVSAGNTDTVKITVTAESGEHGHFIFDWTTGAAAAPMQADLHLVATRRDGALIVKLETGNGNGNGNVAVTTPSGKGAIVVGDNGWKGSWQVVVPARLHVQLHAGVVDGDVKGVAGGLTAHVGVGKLDVAIPRGPVDAHVGVGKLMVAVGSADYGAVRLAAGVGKTDFTVNGRSVTNGYHKEFTSSRQDTTGTGSTAYDLKVGTGKITLELGVKGAGAGGGG